MRPRSIVSREADLFLLGDARDERLTLAELGERVAHRPDDLERDLVEERLRDPEAVAVADRAAHDAAEDVRAAGAVGLDALRDEERSEARVVGEDAHRDVVLRLRLGVRLPRDRGRLVDERAEQIRLVVRRLALDDARDALQAGAGVDAGLRERVQDVPLRLVAGAIELP